MKNVSTSYKGNPKLRRAHIKISMTQHQFDEAAKCANDPIYFIRNYVKIVVLGKGVQPFNLYPFQEDMVKTFCEERFVICKIPRQSGKALPLDEDILTPNGFIKFGDLSVGDKVYGKDGKETTVTFITPIMYNHDCYNITFDDGTTIKADAEHLWEISCSDWNHKLKVKNTQDVLKLLRKKKKNGSGLYVQLNEAIEYPHKPLPIDPYALGVWLGDGTSRTGQITCHASDVETYLTNIPYETKSIITPKNKENIRTILFSGFHSLLKQNNLLRNKHIPQQYLNSSIEQRLDLVRGLMDTDGSVDKQGNFEFYQKNEELIDQFIFLLRSLGVKTRKTYKTIDGRIYFTVRFSSGKYDFFKLKRKLEKQKSKEHYKEKNYRLYIQSIEQCESVPVRCITVDNSDHMFLIGKTLIPTHNSITTIAYLLHAILFNKNYNIAILAHKGSAANGLLARLKLAYENLPQWLQSGIIEWNKGNIELENGSKIGAFATSADGLRSGSYDVVVLDEFAFVQQNLAEEFFTSTYPVITAGDKTKIIIVSTPKGMNHFYTMWLKAEKGLSDYKPIEVHYSAVPGRDEKWREETIRNTSEEQFQQEFCTEFLGSSHTLISASKIKQMFALMALPIEKNDKLSIYEQPLPGHTYCMTVDVAEGQGLDYSTFSVIDVTKIPYKVVAKYRDNTITPYLFPAVIVQVAQKYNEAFVLVEINSIGLQVSDTLHFELGYENLIKIEVKGKLGQQTTPGFKKRVAYGVKTSKQTKMIGCTNLKAMIESDKLLVPDEDTIKEFTTFVAEKQSYKAEQGNTDDLVMTLVHFGWLTGQRYFKENINSDIRQALQQEVMNLHDQDMMARPIIDDGLSDNINDTYEDAKERWVVSRESTFTFDNTDFDFLTNRHRL